MVVSIGENVAYYMLTRIKDVVRLGEGEYADGKIQDEAIDRLIWGFSNGSWTPLPPSGRH